jgi:hypothetical protein
MFVQCHDVSLRLSKDGDNYFLAFNIKFMCPRPQKVQLCTILGLKRASIPKLFGHYSGWNDAANTFLRCHDVLLRLSKGSINHLYVSNIKFVCPRALKVQFCTIFRGRTDRHFRGLFAITREETALQLCLHNVKLVHKVFKEGVSHFLMSNIKFMCPRAQKARGQYTVHVIFQVSRPAFPPPTRPCVR